MNKRLVILGGGESGAGAAVLAKRKSYDVLLMDEGSLKDGYRNELEKEGIPFMENGIDEKLLMNAGEVLKSPGIPDKNTWVKKPPILSYPCAYSSSLHAQNISVPLPTISNRVFFIDADFV